MAARYWRIVSISPHGGGDLEIGELQLWGGGARLDASGTLSATITPAGGDVSDLGDDDEATTVRWPGAAWRQPGFAIHIDAGSAIDVDSVRIATGYSRAVSVREFSLDYSADGIEWDRYLWGGTLDLVSGVQYPAATTLVTVRRDWPSYRYWRLYGTKWSDSFHGIGNKGLMRLSEFELFAGTTQYPTAAMTGASAPSPYVATSSGDLSGHAPWHAFDRVLSDSSANRWLSEEMATQNKWLAIDLGEPRPITRAKITPDGAVSASSGYYLIDFEIQASNTGAFAGEHGVFYKAAGMVRGDWADLTRREFAPAPSYGTFLGVSPTLRARDAWSGFSVVEGAEQPSVAPAALPSVNAHDIEFAGRYAVVGTVKIKGESSNVPARRRVRLLRDLDAYLVRETWSHATTGAFAFTGLTDAYQYTAYAQDHNGDYRAVMADRIKAEVSA